MEILRFEEAGSPTPRRKKSSKGLIIAGLVATLFGIGSAFASTSISINSGSAVGIGSGVSLVTACDTAITVAPHSAVVTGGASGPVFNTDNIALSNIDTATTNASTGLGCGGQYFDLQVFTGATTSAVPYTCSQLNHVAGFNVTYVDGTSKNISATCANSIISFQIPTGIAAANPVFNVPFTSATLDISYITLVSRSS
jgi:hypothetical protein